MVRVRPLSVVALAFNEIGRVRKSGASSSFKFVYALSSSSMLGPLWMFQGGDRHLERSDSQPNELNGAGLVRLRLSSFISVRSSILHHHPCSIDRSRALCLIIMMLKMGGPSIQNCMFRDKSNLGNQ